MRPTLLAVALLAAGCAGGDGDAVPAWVKEEAERRMSGLRAQAEVESTQYESGEREYRVVYLFARTVECRACSRPSIATEPQRGDTAEVRFDRRTRRQTFFGFCNSGGDRDAPLNGCWTDPP